jgi:purine-binding chemotaxis protein CheW
MGQMPAAHAPAQVQEWIVLEVGNVLCGVAITQIQEINKQIEMTPVHQAPAYVRGVINLRGQIVTVIDLRVKFGFLPLELNEERCIVVVRWAGENIGLLADRIQDIVVAEAGDILEPPANISSVTGTFFSGIYPMEHGLIAFLCLSELLKYDTQVRMNT